MRPLKIASLTSLLTLSLLLPCTTTLHAQSLADDIKQLTLDYQKLKEEKSILTGMYSAYTLLAKSFDQIKSIARGNFTLHHDFLTALLAVSPAVRNYHKVANIISNEAELLKEYQSAQHYFRQTGNFTPNELTYFNDLYAGLLSRSLTNLDELAMIMTADQLRMSDAERLAAIDRIDDDMTGRLAALRIFNNANTIQAGQRSLTANDIQSLQSLYGITQ